MRYPSGEDIRIGDRVRLAGREGVVVFSIDAGEFSGEFPQKDWAYLGAGVMLRIKGIGLVHMEGAPDPDLEPIGRAET